MSAGLTFPRAVRSEWLKLRTLRSTWITYAVALVLALGIGALVSFGHGQEVHNHPDRGELFDPVIFTQVGVVFFAQLAIGVMGVLSITGEYATGMIRASMTAVPKRTPVLLAKVLIFALVTVVVSLVMTFGAFFIGQAILSQWNMNGSLSSPGTVRGLLGAAYYVTIVGLIGLGLGFLIRNSAGAIASVVGIVFVAPIIVNFLPSSWSNHVGKFVPLNIAQHLVSTVPTSDSVLTRPESVAVLAAYALIAIALGWVVLKRKDV